MSAASCLLTEDQFLCSICLEVFTDPVTTPCGHNFCETCITEHWKVNAPCQCPNCKKVFMTRPELQVNTFISEMAAQFRQSAQQKASSSSSEQQVSKPGEVPCDDCTGTKLKALKSCLVCLSSYCETHLEPHLTKPGLKKHQLIDPVENLEGRMCTKHDKLLELFCKTDQMFVCMLCTNSDHKTHDVVPLKEEYEGKKAELGRTDTEIQQMIQKRQLRIEEIKCLTELSKKDGDGEIAHGVQVFTALMASFERSQVEFINTIKESQRETGKWAEGLIKELEQEISGLKRISSELEQLSRSEDHLRLLQNFPSVQASPLIMSFATVIFRPPSYEWSVVIAVNQLLDALIKQAKKLFEAKLKRLHEHAVYVPFNLDAVRPKPGQSDQSDVCRCFFSEKFFTSGRSYFEFRVKSWSSWTLGVAIKSYVSEKTRLCPSNHYWTVCRNSRGELFAAADPPVRLSLQSQPEKVGVFVSYEEGLVCFLDVDAEAVIYSFAGNHFKWRLYPFFSYCPNDGFETHTQSCLPSFLQ